MFIKFETMKKHIVLIVVLFSFISCKKESTSKAKWETINVNYLGDFNDIFILPNDTLMILSGLDPTFQKTCIFESDDSGNTWNQKCVDKLVIGGFSNFYCFNHLKIFSGKFRSNDGGTSWKSVGDFNGGLYYFFNNSTGIGISGFTIYKTIDGGNTFSIVYDTLSYVGCQYVQFFDNIIGYAAGGAVFDSYNSGIILKTTNGGNFWAPLPTQFKSIIGMSFITSDIGYIIINLQNGGIDNANLEGVELLKTVDGGNSWISVNSEIFNQFNTMPFECYFLDENNGYICGSALEGSKILSTSDGGKSWKVEYETSSNSHVLIKMIITSATTGYAIGTNGLLLKRIEY